MRPYKGIAETIAAVAGQPELSLTLVGKGRLHDQFRALTDRDNVRFVGSVSDAVLTRLYKSHDLIVKPSTNRLEAFGLALVEGMAAGCVPVTSDIPGVRDVASPTGCIVPPRDVDALARHSSIWPRSPRPCASCNAALERRPATTGGTARSGRTSTSWPIRFPS